jgi:molecular chaperone GrpE
MENTIGSAFNTDLHEAVTNIPAPTEDLKGKVIDELEKGYTLNDKVIRFAKVVVGA